MKTGFRIERYRWQAACLGAALALAAEGARASQEFPERLQQELDLPCTPPCNICHNDNTGGPGNRRLPENGGGFVDNLFFAGLNPGDPSSVAPAIAGLEMAESDPMRAANFPHDVDTDGDGTPDVAQLREARHPVLGTPLCGPEYGCFARVENRSPVDRSAGLSALAVALGLLAAARRRRR